MAEKQTPPDGPFSHPRWQEQPMEVAYMPRYPKPGWDEWCRAVHIPTADGDPGVWLLYCPGRGALTWAPDPAKQRTDAYLDLQSHTVHSLNVLPAEGVPVEVAFDRLREGRAWEARTLASLHDQPDGPVTGGERGR